MQTNKQNKIIKKIKFHLNHKLNEILKQVMDEGQKISSSCDKTISELLIECSLLRDLLRFVEEQEQAK